MPRRSKPDRTADAQQLQLDTDGADGDPKRGPDDSRNHRHEGSPLRRDPRVQSATPGLPAFLARPSGAPIYHGFTIIDESEVDGFRLGMITDFGDPPRTTGDSFIVAPDDSRCGLVWESELRRPYLREVLPADERRWGVWAVGLREPLRSIDDARDFLEALLPELRPHWEAWAVERGGEREPAG